MQWGERQLMAATCEHGRVSVAAIYFDMMLACFRMVCIWLKAYARHKRVCAAGA